MQQPQRVNSYVTWPKLISLQATTIFVCVSISVWLVGNHAALAAHAGAMRVDRFLDFTQNQDQFRKQIRTELEMIRRDMREQFTRISAELVELRKELKK